MTRKFLEDLPGSFSSAMNDIYHERKRQIEAEGWTPQHDDAHTHGELAMAAVCYAAYSVKNIFWVRYWPWDMKWWKPKDKRRDLVKAGALIVAEIERLDRADAQLGPSHLSRVE